jgi:ubiquinone/menaquinone biosynthesis C-methylase UbiE
MNAGRLEESAAQVGRDWVEAPYYAEAERHMEHQWETVVWPFINDVELDLRVVVDLAAGRGRNSEKLVSLAQRLYVVDINESNIRFCRSRFARHQHVTCHVNDGYSLACIDDASVTLVYCFDAMVHFDSDIVRSYLAETRRVLQPGGRGFFHHSNYVHNPGGDFHDNPGWRNFMSKELFHHYAQKERLEVVRQRVVDWDVPSSDCLTLIRRPPRG